ncbi:MAG: hypothetical protein ACLGXA_21265 [Acidobacteriota bacterium]
MKAPRNIILSRKGWDSKAGGFPSPILPDGSLGMIPIPDCNSGVTYSHLFFSDGRCMGPVVERLSKGKILPEHHVHLDPDLRDEMVKRRFAFRPAFGQCGPAQSHLSNRAAGAENDLFLFFGLYRPVDDEWRYQKSDPQHVMFGWLQVERAISLSPGNAIPTHQKLHPHVIPSGIVASELKRQKRDNNTLYLGRDRLSFAPSLPGAAVFQRPYRNAAHDVRRLSTHGHEHCSRWTLPAFFRELSNMGTKQPRCSGDTWCPQRKGPGQEFVLKVTKEIEADVMTWLKRLFAYAE